jgi:WD40 repeat protein
LVLEYAGGGTLRDKIRGWDKDRVATRLKWQKEIAAVIRDVAGAIAIGHAGEHAIIHRDLKPENILFGDDKRPKVADFGLAHMEAVSGVETTGRVGTRQYMAPEQRRGDQVTPKVDVYALGVILYECLTGKRPPSREGLDHEEAVWVTLPWSINTRIAEDLKAICEKCLDPLPEGRLTAQELALDLGRFYRGEPTECRPVNLWQRLGMYALREPLTAALLGVAAIALFSMLVAVTMMMLREGTVAQQRVVIDDQEEALKKAADTRKLSSYASDMQAIQEAWDSNQLGRARELLDRQAAVADSKGTLLRGFEWFYWDRLLKEPVESFVNDARCRCLTVDTKGEYLATSDFEYASVWNIASRQRVHRWKINFRPTAPIGTHDRTEYADSSVAISPDGKLIAATSFILQPQKRLGSLRVWELATGNERLAIREDPSLSGRAVAFSPDGQAIVGTGYRGGWKAWNLDSKKLLAEGRSVSGGVRVRGQDSVQQEGTPTTPTGDIGFAISFSENGRQLVIGSSATAAIVWQWPEATLVPDAFVGWPSLMQHGLAVLPGPECLWGVALRDGAIHLYKRDPLAAPSAAVQLRDFVVDASSPIGCVAMRRTELVGGGQNGAVYRWYVDPNSGRSKLVTMHRGPARRITCVTILPDGRPVSADDSGTICIWPDLKREVIALDTSGLPRIPRAEQKGTAVNVLDSTGKQRKTFLLAPRERLLFSKPSPRGRFLHVFLTQLPFQEVSRPFVWDMETEREVVKVEGRGLGPLMAHLCFNDDESRMAALTMRKEARVWSTGDGSVIRTVPLERGHKLILSRSGRYLAGMSDGAINVWDVEANDPPKTIAVPEAKEVSGPDFRFSDDEQRLILDGTPCTIWDIGLGTQIPATERLMTDATTLDRGECRRLYQVERDEIAICCAKTFQPLLRFKYQSRQTILGPQAKFSPLANGYLRFDALDQLLTQVAAKWDEESGPQNSSTTSSLAQ